MTARPSPQKPVTLRNCSLFGCPLCGLTVVYRKLQIRSYADIRTCQDLICEEYCTIPLGLLSNWCFCLKQKRGKLENLKPHMIENTHTYYGWLKGTCSLQDAKNCALNRRKVCQWSKLLLTLQERDYLPLAEEQATSRMSSSLSHFCLHTVQNSLSPSTPSIQVAQSSEYCSPNRPHSLVQEVMK